MERNAPVFLKLAASSIKAMQCAMSIVRHTNNYRFFESMSLLHLGLLVLKSGCAHNTSLRWTAQDHTLNLDCALMLWKTNSNPTSLSKLSSFVMCDSQSMMAAVYILTGCFILWKRQWSKHQDSNVWGDQLGLSIVSDIMVHDVLGSVYC